MSFQHVLVTIILPRLVCLHLTIALDVQFRGRYYDPLSPRGDSD
jgi:hypothetical protein